MLISLIKPQRSRRSVIYTRTRHIVRFARNQVLVGERNDKKRSDLTTVKWLSNGNAAPRRTQSKLARKVYVHVSAETRDREIHSLCRKLVVLGPKCDFTPAKPKANRLWRVVVYTYVTGRSFANQFFFLSFSRTSNGTALFSTSCVDARVVNHRIGIFTCFASWYLLTNLRRKFSSRMIDVFGSKG